MTGFVARRLLHAIAVMAMAVTLGFALLHLAPGDAMDGHVTKAGRSAESRAALRTRAGLDQPLPVQYARFVTKVLRGDFGHSLIDDQPVVTIVWTALRNSLVLAGAGLLAAGALGLVIGSGQGWRPDRVSFRWLGAALSSLYAIPEFVLAIALIGALASGAGWFPVGGMHDPVTSLLGTRGERLVDQLHHLVLPALTLALGWGAAVARQQRAAITVAAGEDFVRTARAKGRSDVAALTRHAMPATIAPVIAVIGLMLPAMVGGSLIVETVFAWPGLGVRVVRAVAQRDVPVVSGAIVLIALLVAMSSLLVDVCIRAADPRQRASDATPA